MAKPPKIKLKPVQFKTKVTSSIRKNLEFKPPPRVAIEIEPVNIPRTSVVEIPKIKSSPDPKRNLWRLKRAWQKKYALFAQRSLKFNQAKKAQIKVIRKKLKEQAGPYPKK